MLPHVQISRVVPLCALAWHQICVVGVLCGRRSSVFACHALDSFDPIRQCTHHFVRVCDVGIGDVFVLELHSVGKAFALGVFKAAIMGAVVFG